MSQLAQLYVVALTLLLKTLCCLWISFRVKAEVLDKAWKVPGVALGYLLDLITHFFALLRAFALALSSQFGVFFSRCLHGSLLHSDLLWGITFPFLSILLLDFIYLYYDYPISI